jgi:hypothetical protein
LEEIYDEVSRIRTVPQTKNWKFNISGIIGNHCSDSTRFQGKDYFRKVESGTYAFRDLDGVSFTQPLQVKKKTPKPQETSIPESFETITNILRTIKEYRDYSDPASSEWIEYIREFFHIMGFATEKQESRLLFLKDMGDNITTKAIVGIIFPGENFEEIIPGLKWETYIFLAAKYYQMGCGILTDGIHLKVINYGRQKDQSHFWPDLDGIIQYEKLDSFFQIYKIFSFIKGDIENQPQVNLKPKAVIKQKKSINIPYGLSDMLNVCKIMSENGEDYNRACEVVTKMRNLSSPHTVPDACTRRIGIKTGDFRKLYANKTLLINHLIKYFPNFSKEITEALSGD